jgi:hypothetical protein
MNIRTQVSMHFVETMNIRTQVSMHFVETTKIGTKEEEYSSRIN